MTVRAKIIKYLKKEYSNIAGLFQSNEDKDVIKISLMDLTECICKYDPWSSVAVLINAKFTTRRSNHLARRAAELNKLFGGEIAPAERMGTGELACQCPLIARYSGKGDFGDWIIINRVLVGIAYKDNVAALEQLLGEIETKHKSVALAATLPWLIAREIFELFFVIKNDMCDATWMGMPY